MLGKTHARVQNQVREEDRNKITKGCEAKEVDWNLVNSEI